MSVWTEANDTYNAALAKANADYMATKDDDLRSACATRRAARATAVRVFDAKAKKIRSVR